MRKIERPHPTGTKLVRLADVPLDLRLRALQRALREAKTDDEAHRLLMLAIDPGHASGRIAA